MLQSFFCQSLSFRRIRTEAFLCSAKIHIDAVYIFNQLHDLLCGNIVVQPSTECSGKIKFSVGKSACPAKTIHDTAIFAIDTGCGFFLNNRTLPAFNRISLFKHYYIKLRMQFTEFIRSKRTGSTAADNGNIVIRHNNPHSL